MVKLGQPLVAPPPALEAAYLRYMVMRCAYLGRKERHTARGMFIRPRERLRAQIARLSERWGVSQQVVMIVAMELLVQTASGVEMHEGIK